MDEPDILYSVRVDGQKIDTVLLTYNQYKNENLRDEVRRKIAQELHVPTHYIRLRRETE